MSRKVHVHHFVANLTTRQYGRHPTSDLLGVDYTYDVPPDTEFPKEIGRIDLFTRFYLEQPTATTFFVLVRWMDSPDGIPRRVARFGPYRVSFQPTDVVRDHIFRIPHFLVPGVGRYAILLVGKQAPDWKGRRFAKLTETHFLVER
jgi:hypothetical protein